MNEIIVTSKQIYKKGTSLSNCKKRSTLLLADGQVTPADSEDNLQRGVFTLQNTAKNMEWKYNQKNLKRMHF